MLLPAFMDSLEFMPDAAHHPRITIDRLVVVRESWHLEAAGIDFARLRDEAARFAAARHWRRAIGLPRRVFVKSPDEMKPFCVDFDSVISVNEGYSRALFVMSTLPGAAARLHEGWPVSRKDVVTTQHH
jgi:hypothetical protein